MRYLPDVIKEMLSEIPSDKESLIASLEDIMDSASYAPPEGAGLWWRQGAAVLMEELGAEPPMSGWQGKVVDIWMGRA